MYDIYIHVSAGYDDISEIHIGSIEGEKKAKEYVDTLDIMLECDLEKIMRWILKVVNNDFLLTEEHFEKSSPYRFSARMSPVRTRDLQEVDDLWKEILLQDYEDAHIRIHEKFPDMNIPEHIEDRDDLEAWDLISWKYGQE